MVSLNTNDLPRAINVLSERLRDPGWGAGFLRSIAIFSEITDEELVEVYGLGKVLVHNSQSNIVIEGEETRSLFVLVLGTVSVYKRDPNAASLVRLTHLESGEAFGELSLFDNAPRSATITAESDCVLFTLDYEAFHKYLTEKGDNIKARFYQRCAEEIAERFRRQNDDYIQSQQLLWKHALRKGA
jgi:CRP-like cAMP-binding protein